MWEMRSPDSKQINIHSIANIVHMWYALIVPRSDIIFGPPVPSRSTRAKPAR